MGKNEKPKGDFQEKVTLISVTQKTKAERTKLIAEALKIKAEANKMEIENRFLEQKLQLEIERRKKSYSVFDMYILSGVMSTVIGNGESYASPRLFTDDDLIDYKAKMKKMLDEI